LPNSERRNGKTNFDFKSHPLTCECKQQQRLQMKKLGKICTKIFTIPFHMAAVARDSFVNIIFPPTPEKRVGRRRTHNSGGKKANPKHKKVVHEKHFKLMTKRQKREKVDIAKHQLQAARPRNENKKALQSFDFESFIFIPISFLSILSG
jgi:hypothetical protein